MAFQNYLQDEDRFSAYTRIDSTKSPFKDQTVPDYVHLEFCCRLKHLFIGLLGARDSLFSGKPNFQIYL